MILGHEYHSKDSTPSIYVAPTSDNGSALQLTGISLVDANALCVAIVDGNGDQITSFGGGTQYTDAAAAAAHPIGTGIIFNNAGTYNFVSAAQPLPVSATFSPSGTQDVNLKQIGGATFALGQQLAAASIPVILPSATITALTPPAAITGYALDATLTGGTQQTKITDGTNQVGVLKNDGTVASTQNAFLVSGTGMTTTTISLSAGAQNSIWYDMLNYAWVSLEILTNTTPATLSFQTSGDASETNVSATVLQGAGNTGGGPGTSTTSATGSFHGPRSGRYFRISSNLAGGNTATLVLTFYTNASAFASYNANFINVGTANAGADAQTLTTSTNVYMINEPYVFNNTNSDRIRSVINATNSTGTGITAVGVTAQLDDTSPTTITENQFGNIRISADRSMLVANRATTPAQSSVGSSATNITLLALNNARKGATIFNDSTQILYLKLGTTASTTSYTVQMASNGYYEVPFGYIGNIDGLWASANGNARISEFT